MSTPIYCFNVKGKVWNIQQPQVMGILNVTPDSFYDGGKHAITELAIVKAEQLLAEGASIIDIGGQSSRPGAITVSEQEETDRVLPVLEAIIKKYPTAILSVDTYRSGVAKAAVNEGASIINDISGGELDPYFLETVAALKVPYVLMHMQGNPTTMQLSPQYDEVSVEVFDYFVKKITHLKSLGIMDIIIDPGFGFGKTIAHNYQILQHLNLYTHLHCPLLVGFSRKSMITKVLQIDASEALNGTTVLNTIAVQKGAQILRVHDVKAAMEVLKLTQQLTF